MRDTELLLASWLQETLEPVSMTQVTLARNLQNLYRQMAPGFTWYDGTPPTANELNDLWHCASLLESRWHEKWPVSYFSWRFASYAKGEPEDPEKYLNDHTRR